MKRSRFTEEQIIGVLKQERRRPCKVLGADRTNAAVVPIMRIFARSSGSLGSSSAGTFIAAYSAKGLRSTTADAASGPNGRLDHPTAQGTQTRGGISCSGFSGGTFRLALELRLRARPVGSVYST
jgi:hypothetical protein